MNRSKLAALLAVLPITTACVTFSEQEVEAQQEVARELKLPQGYNDPEKSKEFAIPAKSIKAESTDQITSPTTVLIMLEGSWRDNDEQHPSKIMLEKPQLVEDLNQFIDQGIFSYSELSGAKVSKTSTGYNVQITNQLEEGFWLWETTVDAETASFDVVVDVKEHGRSGSVTVDVIDYQNLKPELVTKIPASQRTEALAVQTLNNIMLELDYLYRVQVKKEQTELELSLDLATNISGNFVIRSQQDIKHVWSQTEDVLEEIGFDIEEDDEDLFTFELTYDPAEKSLWNIIFNSEVKELDIASGVYEVSLTSTTTGVHIVFKDKDGDYLSEQQMNSVYEQFKYVVERDEVEL